MVGVKKRWKIIVCWARKKMYRLISFIESVSLSFCLCEILKIKKERVRNFHYSSMKFYFGSFFVNFHYLTPTSAIRKSEKWIGFILLNEKKIILPAGWKLDYILLNPQMYYVLKNTFNYYTLDFPGYIQNWQKLLDILHKIIKKNVSRVYQ